MLTVGGFDGVGARIELPHEGSALEAVATLFGEGPSRVVVSVLPETVAKVLERAAAAKVPALRIGSTGGELLSIRRRRLVRSRSESPRFAPDETRA